MLLIGLLRRHVEGPDPLDDVEEGSGEESEGGFLWLTHACFGLKPLLH